VIETVPVVVAGVARVSTPPPDLFSPPVPVTWAATVRSLPAATVNRAGLPPNARVPLVIPPFGPPVARTAPEVTVRVPPPTSTDPPRMRRAFAPLAPVTLAGAVTSKVAVELPEPDSGVGE
jgi:hypothetical protein